MGILIFVCYLLLADKDGIDCDLDPELLQVLCSLSISDSPVHDGAGGGMDMGLPRPLL